MAHSIPDELVLIILSFCHLDDIKNARASQTEFVRRSTETTTKMEAARNNNFDNLKWIYGYIKDTKFTIDYFFERSYYTGK